jgi:hypothetical protein
MRKFQTYIIESTNEDKLTHLEHAEDHPINAGAAGFQHAKKTLMAGHNALLGKQTNATVTTKYDGSPSIVFGHHPETGKFFVASKSAFNKNPKLNYTEKDIEANHGHAPGLVSKLSAALKHLPKVTPKEGVYQGDVMHSGVQSKSNPHGDVKIRGGQAHFTPNTITYSTKKPGEAEKVADSKIGVAVHTAYHGPSFEKMKAQYNTGHAGFGSHKDVHLMDVTHDIGKSKYTPEQQATFKQHMAKAEEHHNAIEKAGGYHHLEPHTEHLKTYINKTVRTGDTPSTKGYNSHLGEIHQKLADKVKTPASKADKMAAGEKMINHVETHREVFNHLWGMHHSLQTAKDQLAHSFSSHTDYGHSVGNKKVKPEGHVIAINNRPTKIVDRAEFSKNNFNKTRG